MPKEINISVRGMMEDLPQEIEELLRSTEKKLDECSHGLGNAINRLHEPAAIQHCLVDLEEIRRTLYRVDNRIADCSQILASYFQYMEGAPAEEPSVPVAPQSSPPVVTDEE